MSESQDVDLPVGEEEVTAEIVVLTAETATDEVDAESDDDDVTDTILPAVVDSSDDVDPQLDDAQEDEQEEIQDDVPHPEDDAQEEVQDVVEDEVEEEVQGDALAEVGPHADDEEDADSALQPEAGEQPKVVEVVPPTVASEPQGSSGSEEVESEFESDFEESSEEAVVDQLGVDDPHKRRGTDQWLAEAQMATIADGLVSDSSDESGEDSETEEIDDIAELPKAAAGSRPPAALRKRESKLRADSRWSELTHQNQLVIGQFIDKTDIAAKDAIVWLQECEWQLPEALAKFRAAEEANDESESDDEEVADDFADEKVESKQPVGDKNAAADLSRFDAEPWKKEAIGSFMAFTRADVDTAEACLVANRWEVEVAADVFLRTGKSMAEAGFTPIVDSLAAADMADDEEDDDSDSSPTARLGGDRKRGSKELDADQLEAANQRLADDSQSESEDDDEEEEDYDDSDKHLAKARPKHRQLNTYNQSELDMILTEQQSVFKGETEFLRNENALLKKLVYTLWMDRKNLIKQLEGGGERQLIAQKWRKTQASRKEDEEWEELWPLLPASDSESEAESGTHSKRVSYGGVNELFSAGVAAAAQSDGYTVAVEPAESSGSESDGAAKGGKQRSGPSFGGVSDLFELQSEEITTAVSISLTKASPPSSTDSDSEEDEDDLLVLSHRDEHSRGPSFALRDMFRNMSREDSDTDDSQSRDGSEEAFESGSEYSSEASFESESEEGSSYSLAGRMSLTMPEADYFAISSFYGIAESDNNLDTWDERKSFIQGDYGRVKSRKHSMKRSSHKARGSSKGGIKFRLSSLQTKAALAEDSRSDEESEESSIDEAEAGERTRPSGEWPSAEEQTDAQFTPKAFAGQRKGARPSTFSRLGATFDQLNAGEQKPEAAASEEQHIGSRVQFERAADRMPMQPLEAAAHRVSAAIFGAETELKSRTFEQPVADELPLATIGTLEKEAIRGELKAEARMQAESELRPQIEAEMRQTLLETVRMDVEQTVRSEVESELNVKLQSQRSELTLELAAASDKRVAEMQQELEAIEVRWRQRLEQLSASKSLLATAASQQIEALRLIIQTQMRQLQSVLGCTT